MYRRILVTGLIVLITYAGPALAQSGSEGKRSSGSATSRIQPGVTTPRRDLPRGIQEPLVNPRIRKLTDEIGTRRGRPLLVAAIVPDNLQLATNVGLDVRTWVREDLVDILVPDMVDQVS